MLKLHRLGSLLCELTTGIFISLITPSSKKQYFMAIEFYFAWLLKMKDFFVWSIKQGEFMQFGLIPYSPYPTHSLINQTVPLSINYSTLIRKILYGILKTSGKNVVLPLLEEYYTLWSLGELTKTREKLVQIK